MKQNEFFLKQNNLQSVQKIASEKTPLTLYGMKANIFFLHFQKVKKYLLSLIME